MPGKIKIELSPYSDIGILAVCAPMRDYRFIWHINNHLALSFSQDFPLIWHNRKTKSDTEFAVFRCPETDGILIINNRYENFVLLPALTTIDYFVVFTESPSQPVLEKWVSEIRSIQGVTMVTPLDKKYIEDFSHILSELEFQEMHRKKESKGKPKGY